MLRYYCSTRTLLYLVIKICITYYIHAIANNLKVKTVQENGLVVGTLAINKRSFVNRDINVY